jgi:hypothetical protein
VDAERYREWWPSCIGFRELASGVVGVGSSHERVVRGRLPYNLRYVIKVTHYDPPRELTYDSVGDLQGRGRFLLDEKDGWTDVLLYWDVSTTGVFMNVLAPVLRWLFAWNHDAVMVEGERGLAALLKKQSGAPGPPS